MSDPEGIAAELLRLTQRIIVPMCGIERTISLPPPASHRENDAEHSFGLAIVACSLAGRIEDRLDTGLVAEYALVHDILEVYTGDLSVYQDLEGQGWVAAADAATLLSDEFSATNPWLAGRVRDYLGKGDEESRFVYALDKIIPHALVLLADSHPLNPSWDEYSRTEEVAKKKVRDAYPALLPLFEELCKMFASRPHLFRVDEA